MAARLVPLVERRGPGFRRFLLVSFPAAIVVVASLAASLCASDRAKQARENARAMPPPGSPNVLLVVMDTVAAGHLSLHGYGRATSTTLVELAEHGIQFDAARATSFRVGRDDRVEQRETPFAQCPRLAIVLLHTDSATCRIT
jgi:hypothetical protein